jgi:hypothetical protein
LVETAHLLELLAVQTLVLAVAVVVAVAVEVLVKMAAQAL